MLDYQRKHLFLSLAVAIIFIVLFAYLYFDYISARSKMLNNAKSKLISEEFRRKQTDIEGVFNLIYQATRTIGLLPSVRSIEGGNRKSEDEDIVAEGRFSQEGYLTVQQIYNNLAANVSVSEIYSVVKGFKQGEIPFFMFDSLIIGSQSGSDNEETRVDPDFPAELEDEEYEYYPKQIAYFQQKNPYFTYIGLDEIPAISSPPMRTCDNTQYYSKENGDVKDADGILYSVPFYDNNGNLNGIISTIFRTNVLEAMLLDLPFLILTGRDRANAARLGLKMPERTSNFVLINKAMGISIADRRDNKIVSQALSALGSGMKGDNYFIDELKIKDQSLWLLYYRYDPAVLKNMVSHQFKMFFLKAAMLSIVTLLILVLIYADYRKRQQILAVAFRLKEMAEVGGNLTSRLDESRKDEIGELSRRFNGFVSNLSGIVESVMESSKEVTSKSNILSTESRELSKSIKGQSDKSSVIASSSEELSQTVAEIASNTSVIAEAASDTVEKSNTGLNVINEAIKEVQKISESVMDSAKLIDSLKLRSGKITEIVVVINDIADQTNLLALNAAIEAARAGEQGRGFAVVADEVRKLAERTASSTGAITDMVKSIQNETAEASNAMQENIERVNSGVELSEKAGKNFMEILDSINGLQEMIQQIASATEEMSATSDHISQNIEDIANISEDSSERTNKIASDISNLGKLSEGLISLVERFKIS